MASRLKAFSSLILNSNKQNVARVLFRSNHKNSPNDKTASTWNEEDESELKKTDASEDFWFKNLTTVKNVERKLRAGDQPLNEQSDWFKSLTKGGSGDRKEGFQMSPKLTTKQKIAQAKTKEEKREIIEKCVDFAVMNDVTLPHDLSEEEWNMLMECSSLNQVKLGLVRIAKERHYLLLKQEKRKLKALKDEEIQAKKEAGLWEYKRHNGVVRQPTKVDERKFLRDRIASAIINDNPSVVFDFRYEYYFHRANMLASLYRQYIEIIGKNRYAKFPFQIYFCNYSPDSIFNQKYRDFIEVDKNMIEATSKSYTDIFPKEKLVYLSRDSQKVLTTYDPNKVYIIGNIIDTGEESDSYASYTQAKKDGIECVRLPLDENIKWQSGQKNLAMNHVFNLLLKVSHGVPWHKAFETIIPRRFVKSNDRDQQRLPQNRFGELKYESFTDNSKSRKSHQKFY